MGLDYSLCAVFRKTLAEGMLQDLSELLDQESRQRIVGLKKWLPHSEEIRQTIIGTKEVDGRGIAGLEPGEYEDSNHLCFSLLIQLETEMEKHLSDHGFQCFEKADRFGCIWTSVFSGREYVLLQMTAATTSMSIVLKESRAIQDKWADFAKKSGALFAYLDLEDQVAIQVFPDFADLDLPDYATLYFSGDCHFSVDRFVEYIRNANEV